MVSFTMITLTVIAEQRIFVVKLLQRYRVKIPENYIAEYHHAMGNIDHKFKATLVPRIK